MNVQMTTLKATFGVKNKVVLQEVSLFYFIIFLSLADINKKI